MSEIPVIYLFSPRSSPRLDYACELIFTHILGVKYQGVNKLPEEEVPLIQYTATPGEKGVWIPAQGLLFEEGVDYWEMGPFPKRGLPPDRHPGGLSFDLLGWTFYLSTEYEKYVEDHLDGHGRYELQAYRSGQEKWYESPWIHHWADRLWKHLKQLYPQLERPSRRYDYCLTFDIDHPWKHRYKAPHIQAGGMLKSVLKGNWEQLRERRRSIFQGEDPYDTFEEIFLLCPKEKTRFFFLGERKSSHDTRHTFQHPAYRQLIQRIVNKGYSVGIHPSYTSWQNPLQIREERDVLEEIVGEKIIHSRQHYLKYLLPHTFRYLYEAGIRHEYTLCVNHALGFRTGMAIPYPWFDVDQNRQTSLQLYPTLVMDVSLKQYLQLAPKAAVQAVKRLVSQTQEIQGVFTLLIHNDALSNSEPWEGWKECIIEIINVVKGYGADHSGT